MKTKVTKVSENGAQAEFCEFVNKFGAKYNLVTLCMQMHKNNNILDAEQRKRFESKIIEAKHSFFFEYGTDVYITLK